MQLVYQKKILICFKRGCRELLGNDYVSALNARKFEMGNHEKNSNHVRREYGYCDIANRSNTESKFLI